MRVEEEVMDVWSTETALPIDASEGLFVEVVIADDDVDGVGVDKVVGILAEVAA